MWTSTTSRTMQTVAVAQLPGGGGGRWLLGWSTENRDCLSCHGKIPWEGLLASLKVWGPLDSLNC